MPKCQGFREEKPLNMLQPGKSLHESLLAGVSGVHQQIPAPCLAALPIGTAEGGGRPRRRGRHGVVDLESSRGSIGKL